MGSPGHLPAPARRPHRPPEVRAARRPALRQRRAAHGPRRQQGAQGHDHQGAPARRLRRPLRARLGLPRPADREPDREDLRPRPAAGRGAGQEPRLCHRADRAADGRLQAPGRAGRLGPPLPHDGLRQRSQRDPRAQAGDGARLRLPRPEAGLLVLRLRQFAGRIRDRVRGQAVADGRCRLPQRRARPAGRRLRPASPHEGRLRRHLDDDRLDHPRQPGVEPEPGAGVFAGRHRTRPAGPGLGAGRSLPAALRPHRHGRRHDARPEARRAELPPPAGACGQGLRPALARLPGRLRHRRRRHRHRPLVAGLRRGRLQLLRRARPEGRRHPEPGAGARPLRRCAAAVRRPEHLEGRAAGGRCLARCRPAVRHRQAHAQLPALLAPQDAGDLPRRRAVVRAHGRRRRRVHDAQGAQRACARSRSTPSTRRASTPRTAAPACAT